MTRQFSTINVLGALIGLFMLAAGGVSLTANTQVAHAAIDNTPDCDTVAILKCGAFSESALKKAYDKDSYGDIEKVYSAFHISKSDLSGFKSGIVYRNGNVTVDGKVVATDAMTAGRNYGGTKITGTKNVGKYSVSKFVDEGQTAFVKLKSDGTFDFAIVKACGNPVVATPKPAPKPMQVEVCNPKTGETETVDKTDQDKYKPAGDDACVSTEVCELKTHKTTTIKEADYTSSKYSRDLSDCEETIAPAVTTPPKPQAEQAVAQTTKLPSTGPEQFVVGGLGLSSLTAAGYYAHASRRHLVKLLLRK